MIDDNNELVTDRELYTCMLCGTVLEEDEVFWAEPENDAAEPYCKDCYGLNETEEEEGGEQ